LHKTLVCEIICGFDRLVLNDMVEMNNFITEQTLTRRTFIKSLAAWAVAPKEILRLVASNVYSEPTTEDITRMQERLDELETKNEISSTTGAPTWMGRGHWEGNFRNRAYLLNNIDPMLLESYMRSHNYCAISPILIPAFKTGLETIYFKTVGNKPVSELNSKEAYDLFIATSRNKRLSEIASNLIGLEVIFNGWGFVRPMINADVLAVRHTAIHEGYIPRELIVPQLPQNEIPSDRFIADIDPYEFSKMRKSALIYNEGVADNSKIDPYNITITIPETEKWQQLTSLQY
jgi:hypothetical protein